MRLFFWACGQACGIAMFFFNLKNYEYFFYLKRGKSRCALWPEWSAFDNVVRMRTEPAFLCVGFQELEAMQVCILAVWFCTNIGLNKTIAYLSNIWTGTQNCAILGHEFRNKNSFECYAIIVCCLFSKFCRQIVDVIIRLDVQDRVIILHQ